MESLPGGGSCHLDMLLGRAPGTEDAGVWVQWGLVSVPLPPYKDLMSTDSAEGEPSPGQPLLPDRHASTQRSHLLAG